MGVLIPVELQSWGSRRSRRSRRSKRRCYSTGCNNDRSSWSNTGWMTPSDERLRLKGWQDWIKNFLGLQKNIWWSSSSPYSSLKGPKWLCTASLQNSEILRQRIHLGWGWHRLSVFGPVETG